MPPTTTVIRLGIAVSGLLAFVGAMFAAMPDGMPLSGALPTPSLSIDALHTRPAPHHPQPAHHLPSASQQALDLSQPTPASQAAEHRMLRPPSASR